MERIKSKRAYYIKLCISHVIKNKPFHYIMIFLEFIPLYLYSITTLIEFFGIRKLSFKSISQYFLHQLFNYYALPTIFGYIAFAITLLILLNVLASNCFLIRIHQQKLLCLYMVNCFEIIYFRYFSSYFIEVICYYLYSTSYAIIHFFCWIMLACYISLAIKQFWSIACPFKIGISQQTINEREFKGYLHYPFDSQFSYHYETILIIMKVLKSLHYNSFHGYYNTISFHQLIIFLYAFILCGYYIGLIIMILFLKNYMVFTYNQEFNLLRFWLLQCNVFSVLLSVCCCSYIQHYFFIVITILISMLLSWIVLYILWEKVFKAHYLMDTFSEHQIMYLIGLNDNETISHGKSLLILIITQMIIMHKSSCQIDINACVICKTPKSDIDFTREHYLSLYYDYSHLYWHEKTMNTYLLKLYITFINHRHYVYYSNLYVSMFNKKNDSKGDLRENVSIIFTHLAEQNIYLHDNETFFGYLFKLKKNINQFNHFLELLEEFYFSTLLNYKVIFIELGQAIQSFKEQLTKYSGINSQLENYSVNGLIQQSLFDNFRYISLILRYCQEIFLNSLEYQDILRIYEHINADDFIMNMYLKNNCLFLQYYYNDHGKEKVNIIFVGRVPTTSSKKSFFSLFPKKYKIQARESFLTSLRKVEPHKKGEFSFFMNDKNNFVVDFCYTYSLITNPKYNEILIKGEMDFNLKDFICFQNVDQERFLIALSAKISQLCGIDPSLIRELKENGIHFSFNDIFIKKTSIKTETYQFNFPRIYKKLMNIFPNNAKRIQELYLGKERFSPMIITLVHYKEHEPNYSIYSFHEKNSQPMKTIGFSTYIDPTDQLSIIHINESSSMKMSSTTSNYINAKTVENHQYDDTINYHRNAFLITILIFFFDIIIVLITVLFLFLQSRQNKEIMDYYSIYLYAEEIQSFFSGMNFEILLTLSVYNEDSTKIIHKLTEFNNELDFDFEHFIYEDLAVKIILFKEILNNLNNKIYQKNDAKLNDLLSLNINYTTVSFLFDDNKTLSTQTQITSLNNGLNLFIQHLLEIINKNNEDNNPVDDITIQLFTFCKNKLYFTKNKQKKINNSQKTIYEIILNFTNIYCQLDFIMMTLQKQLTIIYELDIVIMVVLSLVSSLIKFIVVTLCCFCIYFGAKVINYQIEEIKEKLSNPINITYFKTQIENFKDLMLLYNKNPLRSIDTLIIAKKAAKKQLTPTKQELINNPHKTEDLDTRIKLMNTIPNDLLQNYFKPGIIMIKLLYTVLVIVSIVNIGIFFIWINRLNILLNYSKINSTIEINIYRAAALSQIMILSNRTQFEYINGLTMNEYITSLITTIFKIVKEKDYLENNYPDALNNLTNIFDNATCSGAIDLMKDNRHIQMLTERGIDYNKAFIFLCCINSYDESNHSFIYYDLTQRINHYLKKIKFETYESLLKIFNDIEAMWIYSTLLLVFRPLVNHFNSNTISQLLISFSSEYTIVLIGVLLINSFMDCLIFFLIWKAIIQKTSIFTQYFIDINQAMNLKPQKERV